MSGPPLDAGRRDAERFRRVAEIFEAARAADPGAWAAYLDEACAGDEGLRREVEKLLAAHEDPRDFGLDTPPAAPPRALTSRPEAIGPFRILDLLGEGGMGEVYLAEQSRPVRRRVALKLVKRGLDTGAVMARFASERQALALMNHPAIARVFDAGETEDGRPYFVMEYVDGEPITEWCDRRDLDLAARLSLLRDVCAGVHHAHLKGVIHRDLKPSNVLVTEVDGRPQPKIIDFGIAKAIESDHDPAPLLTQDSSIIGTPAYMSPEQARGDTAHVDTRTDIYSLGVILYELLAGDPPFAPTEIREAGILEMLRRIRDDEPPPPSRRVSRRTSRDTSRDTGRDTGQATGPRGRREAERAPAGRRLRGDLDAITLKALAKEPARRYPSAAALAEEIVRYLNHEPIEARAPGLAYRAAKFARRHRTAVYGAASVAAALVVTLLVSVWLYLGTRRALADESRALTRAERASGRAERAAARAREQAAIAEARLTEVLRLSGIRKLSELRARAERLWPARPETAGAMAVWLKDAGDLVDELGKHRAALAAIRKHGAEHRHAPAEAVEERAGLLAWRAGTHREVARCTTRTTIHDPSATSPSPEMLRLRHRFRLSAPDAARPAALRWLARDGAVAWLNGVELARTRWRLAPGSEAPIVAPNGGHRFEVVPVPVGRLRVGENVLAVAVRRVAGGRPRLALAADLHLADGRAAVALDAAWRYRPGDPPPEERDWVQPGFDAAAWARGPGPLGIGVVDALTDADRRSAAADRERIAWIDRRVASLDARIAGETVFTFASHDLQWQHDTLASLVEEIASLEAPDPFGLTREALARRHRFASTIRERSVDRRRADWDRAIAAIADPGRCPAYRGLRLSPQVGLVPIGPDPDSGLWEFAHLATGVPPERGADGRLRITAETGVVLVLVPGGAFTMGAERPRPGRPAGSPHTDPWAVSWEAPAFTVRLAPFFIAKFELTQGQWRRFTGRSPSAHAVGKRYGRHLITPLHPVESVSWFEFDRELERMGLALPTEAQWEYAARAGTTTVWWCGSDRESLRGVANIADRSGARGPLVRVAAEWPEYDDGYMVHAPVGTFRANAFGLHEVLGNVSEWCRDALARYICPRDPADGAALESVDEATRVYRGGGYNAAFRQARSARRFPNPPRFQSAGVGVRPVRAIDR